MESAYLDSDSFLNHTLEAGRFVLSLCLVRRLLFIVMLTVEKLIRYIVEPKKKQAVSVKPPFLRPDLSERQITVKISDNGIQANLNRSKVRQPSSTAFEEYGLGIMKLENEFVIENLWDDAFCLFVLENNRGWVLVVYFLLWK